MENYKWGTGKWGRKKHLWRGSGDGAFPFHAACDEPADAVSVEWSDTEPRCKACLRLIRRTKQEGGQDE